MGNLRLGCGFFWYAADTKDHDSTKKQKAGVKKTHTRRTGNRGVSLPLPLCLVGELSLSENNESKRTKEIKIKISLNRAIHSNLISVQCLFGLYFHAPRQDKR